MTRVRAEYQGGDRFTIAIRGHTLAVDQPGDAGGQDTAPTPTEMFIASLASCVGFYAHRYLARHQLPAAGLVVTAEYTLEQRPARVGQIHLELHLPTDVPAERRDALLAVAAHCTVHNSLTQPPQITITLNGEGDVHPDPVSEARV